MTELMLASRNRKKRGELEAILSGSGIRVRSLEEFPEVAEVEEIGRTFAENAVLKAEAVAQATGLPTLADDSGLCVEALGGEPGVRSARYAGEPANSAANNVLLLKKLAEVPTGEREAHFACVLALAIPGKATIIFAGRCDGDILFELRGENGFGYDPLFYSKELGKSFAEAEPEEKNRVSHRARALLAFRKEILE
ncbi:MAG: XTP/dITP diphosphatase [Planctomycetes bacterium]|nr:XTP/dITP diphosphatase [Planctomycetota bacterium]